MIPTQNLRVVHLQNLFKVFSFSFNNDTDCALLERCHGGTRWAHGCGAQCTQVWVADTRRGGGTPG